MARIGLVIEQIQRDRDSILLIAHKLANLGHTVIVGKRIPLLRKLKYFKIDAIVYHNGEREIINSFNRPSTIFILDQESLVISENKLLSRLEYADSEHDLHYFAVSERVVSILNQNATTTEFIITGNPRFDLLKEPYQQIYTDRIQDIKNQYPNLALICGKLASSPNDDSGNMKSMGSMDCHWLQELDKLIFGLHKSGYNVVVRPHHGENVEKYKNLKSRNLFDLNFDDSIKEWLKAASLVIQNNSTVGLESIMCSTPTLGFELSARTPNTIVIPNNHMLSGQSSEELLAYAENPDSYIIENQFINMESLFRDCNSYSFELIANYISMIVSDDNRFSIRENVNINMMHRLVNLIKEVPFLYKSRPLYYSMMNIIHGFEGIENRYYLRRSDVRKFINGLNEISGTNVSVQDLSKWDDVYMIRLRS